MGSYVSTSATVPNGIAGEFKLNGQFTTYSITQTEAQTTNAVLSRLILGSGFNVQAGYLLPSDWAISGRYTTLKNDIISANFADYNKFYTLVATRYLSGHNLKVQAEIGFDELRAELKTATQVGNYYTQVMVTVQL